MTNFHDTPWAQKEFSSQFLETADVLVMERRRFFEILKSLYSHFLEDRGEHNNVLDVGCGDGILTHELLKTDSSISATLIDGSEDMLIKARKRLSGFSNVDFIQASFQELVHSDIQLPDFSLAISSLAIHHLAMNEKRDLFDYIYSHLGDGGYFVNIDVVLSPTDALEKWYRSMWKKWMIDKQAILKIEVDCESIFQSYQEKGHYSKLDTLTSQLNALTNIGFKDVDCFYKYGVFAMYGGKK